MFKSTADVFRTRQAVWDLAEAVRRNSPAVERLGTTSAERDAILRIVAAGCRIGVGDARAYDQLLLSAAMPENDFSGFATATAILLMDRLQGGAGHDDLFWNWDAFRDHYPLADPPVRAALMNGFRAAAASGLVTLEHGPEGSDCLTRAEDDVMSLLLSEGDGQLADAIGDNISPEEAGRIWHRTDSQTLSWQAHMGFRYLYERPSSMAPPDPEDAALIPWA